MYTAVHWSDLRNSRPEQRLTNFQQSDSSHLGPGVLDVPSPDVGLDVKFGFNDLCPVCGDKVSGFHYGLLTCESCKGENFHLIGNEFLTNLFIRIFQTNSTE